MSEHKAKLLWQRQTADFAYDTYDRSHAVTMEGGAVISASAAPEYKGKKELVNPEEMLAASAASCHMLTFLAVAARSHITVDRYEDSVVAVLEKNAEGVLAVTTITLHPKIVFSGENLPDAAKLKDLHDKAHRNCFIANSIKCRIVVES